MNIVESGGLTFHEPEFGLRFGVGCARSPVGEHPELVDCRANDHEDDEDQNDHEASGVLLVHRRNLKMSFRSD